jgi:hypothetical protein
MDSKVALSDSERLELDSSFTLDEDFAFELEDFALELDDFLVSSMPGTWISRALELDFASFSEEELESAFLLELETFLLELDFAEDFLEELDFPESVFLLLELSISSSSSSSSSPESSSKTDSLII